MEIELRPLVEIKPYEKNPRLNDAAVEAVARSIREFGFRQPIVVDADGVIVVGQTRYKAAQQLGLKQVPVHAARELTPEQARAYRIADNATAAGLSSFGEHGLMHHQSFGDRTPRSTVRVTNGFVSFAPTKAWERRMRWIAETFRWDLAGRSILSGKVWPTAGSESCVVVE